MFSHGAAAVVAIELARSGRIPVALVAALVTGMILTWTLQRTIWLAHDALSGLNAGRQTVEIPARRRWPLSHLVTQVNALIASQRQVRDLRQNLLRQVGESAAQQERNRLARELHDSIKQQIFGISIGAAAAQARWESDPQAAQRALGDVQRSAREAMVEMNALLQQLSPAPLERVGLRQALREQGEAFGYRTGADVQVTFGELPADDRMPAGAQESLFRIAQEALSNVARHARAGQVCLSLGLCDPEGPLELAIRDDGLGFEPEVAQGGMGLANIRQRVLALGGEVAIRSSPSRGTLVRASIPLVELHTVPPEHSYAYPPDHTLNRTCLVGIGGGLALIAVLFYPLSRLAPHSLVGRWTAGAAAVALALLVVAALMPLAVGFLAACWTGIGTRQEGTLLGGLAGGVSGSILYLGLAGAAAGVMGSSVLLEHGLVPASGSDAALYLLTEAANGTIWAAYGTFWLALLAGTGLGALGGLLAPQGCATRHRSTLRPAIISILAAAALPGGLSLGAALFIFPQLESALRSLPARHGMAPMTALPLAGISLWPIGTQSLLYLGSLLALLLLLRGQVRLEEPARIAAAQIRIAELGLLALAPPVAIWLLGRQAPPLAPVLRALLIVVAAASLILAGLYALLFVETHRRQRLPDLDQASILRVAAITGVVLSLAALAWSAALPSLLSVLVTLGMIAASAFLVASLWRQPEPRPRDTLAWARLQLSMSSLVGAGLGTMLAMITPLMALIAISLTALTIFAPFQSALADTAAGGQLVPPGHTSIGLAQNAYLTGPSAILISLLGAAAILGLRLLVTSGRIALGRRRWPHLGD
jgi:signal transduction histidine kinase